MKDGYYWARSKNPNATDRGWHPVEVSTDWRGVVDIAFPGSDCPSGIDDVELGDYIETPDKYKDGK